MGSINDVKIVNKYKPLYVGEQQCLSHRKGKLYSHSLITDKPVYFGSLPMTKKQRFFSQIRLTERLFRLEPRAVIAIEAKKYLVSFCGAVYCANFQTGVITCEHVYRQGMNNPLNLCTIKGIDGFDDCITYGEYWGNVFRDEVSVYARKNGTWEKIFTFPKGKVQHIHGIIADPYRNCVLILTGDKDDESGIWIAKNNFQEVKPLLIGSQRYRACVAFPIEEGIIYATDSPLEKNVIAIAKKNTDGWKEKVLYDIPGPCIYGTKVEEKYVFATSVEPDSRIQGMRYKFTYSLGEGIKDRNSHIVMGNIDEGFKEVIKFKKDFFPMLLFQFGNVQFPSGVMKKGIVMYPVSVRKYDGNTVVYNY